MKYKTIKSAYSMKGVGVSSESSTITVATKSWYEKPAVWISIITFLIGLVGLVQQYFPHFAGAAVLVSVLNLILNSVETVVVPSSVAGNVEA